MPRCSALPKIASCRTFRPAAVQLRKLAAGGEISDIAHVCIAVIDSFTQIEEHGTMEDSAEHYTLSYPVWSVTWDGRRICGRPLEESCRQLDELAACGIYEVMLSGYHCEEEADFDMDAETVKLGAALRERGCKAPRDVSVISFDNSAFAGLAHPALTTLNHPKDDFGALAARKLLRMMAGEREESAVLSWSLVERESLGRP